MQVALKLVVGGPPRGAIIDFVERRRDGETRQSARSLLSELPALVVLERFPVPVLAIAEDGSIIFANGAFGDMVGRSVDDVTALTFRQVFHTMPTDGSVLSVLRAHGGLIVELRHGDGSVVRARMSKSALLRGDDPMALATFHDITERLWSDEL
jgi:PAS domain S-box-containing protein